MPSQDDCVTHNNKKANLRSKYPKAIQVHTVLYLNFFLVGAFFTKELPQKRYDASK